MTEEAVDQKPTEEVNEPSLDDLLNEYDSEAEQQAAPEDFGKAEKQEAPRLPPDYDHVRQFAQQYAADQTRKAINETVEGLKAAAENLKDIDNEVIEGMLQARAARDPRIAQAWALRYQRPGEWKKINKTLAKEFDQKFRRPDKQITEDRDALRAAVRSGPVESKPEIPDLNKMSDAEFAAFKASL